MILFNRVKFNLLKVTALFSVLSCVILLIVKIYFSLSFLPDISGSETSTIFPVQFLSDDKPIYTDPELPPFRLTQYTPLYFILTSFLFDLTGWAPEEVHKVFLVSRFSSIGLTLLTVLVIFLLISRIAKQKSVYALLAACFIFQILGFWFLTSSRPDSLLVLLTSLYLCAVFKAILSEQENSIWWILAIFISVTAFFVKQSGAIHSIALAAFCVYQYRWKLLIRLIMSGILFFVIYYIILPTGSIPEFISNTVGGVANSTSPGWFYTWTLEKLLLQFAPLLALNFVITIFSIFNSESSFLRFLSISSLLFFVFATATAFKIGAGVGYYQDYLIVAVVQIVLFFTESSQKSHFQTSFHKLILALYLVFVCLHCTLFVYMSYSSQPAEVYLSRYIEQRKVADYLSKERKLTDQDWVYVSEAQDFHGYYIKHFLFRNVLVPFSDLVYLTSQNKTFNYSGFKKMVMDKKVRYVIARKGDIPQNILGYKFQDLRKIKSIESYDIYEN